MFGGIILLHVLGWQYIFFASSNSFGILCKASFLQEKVRINRQTSAESDIIWQDRCVLLLGYHPLSYTFLQKLGMLALLLCCVCRYLYQWKCSSLALQDPINIGVPWDTINLGPSGKNKSLKSLSSSHSQKFSKRDAKFKVVLSLLLPGAERSLKLEFTK